MSFCLLIVGLKCHVEAHRLTLWSQSVVVLVGGETFEKMRSTRRKRAHWVCILERKIRIVCFPFSFCFLPALKWISLLWSMPLHDVLGHQRHKANRTKYRQKPLRPWTSWTFPAANMMNSIMYQYYIVYQKLAIPRRWSNLEKTGRVNSFDIPDDGRWIKVQIKCQVQTLMLEAWSG